MRYYIAINEIVSNCIDGKTIGVLCDSDKWKLTHDSIIHSVYPKWLFENNRRSLGFVNGAKVLWINPKDICGSTCGWGFDEVYRDISIRLDNDEETTLRCNIKIS